MAAGSGRWRSAPTAGRWRPGTSTATPICGTLRTGVPTVIPEPGTVWAVAYSRDGTLAIGDADGAAYLRAATAAEGQGSVLADPASGSEGVGALAFSADGRQLAAGDSNGTTYLWRAG